MSRLMMLAIRWPRPVVVASSIRVLVNSVLPFERFARTAGIMIIAPKKIGPKIVAKTNHFVRTLSRYSRLMIAQSLAMSCHPHFNSGRADLLEEDLVQ